MSLPTETSSEPQKSNSPTATRKDLQWPRRMFHLSMGLIAAFIYQNFLTHKQAVYILGGTTCILYILEQVRLNYPDFAAKFTVINRYMLRAEEELKESSAIPYIMGLLLTILSFPKPLALASILILALADPFSAIVGIQYGKRKITANKTLEGSLTFFVFSFFATYVAFSPMTEISLVKLFSLCLVHAICMALFEIIPLRLDDNLTIPITSASWLWILTALFGIDV